MHITNISEAKATLSYLIKKVQETKEPIIIGRAGEPVAVISPYSKEDEPPRQLGGSWQGKVKISADFDEIDAEIADSFYNSRLIPE
ncbi:MAG: type II toxin-antitoxin system Phd/YefM family antitoxin [Deltaproteobacteria bacterium]|nr:type II toxin-antitoxin system Phd/YefM family antitoxin [Candidatus Anaeroferrophillacea bacterium]